MELNQSQHTFHERSSKMGSFEINVIFLISLSIASLQLELYYYSALEAKETRCHENITNGFYGPIELYSGFSYTSTVEPHSSIVLSSEVDQRLWYVGLLC